MSRLVPAKPLLVRSPVDVTFRLAPGDRPLIAAGESVVVGAPIAERLRDPSLEEVHSPAAVGRAASRSTLDSGRSEDVTADSRAASSCSTGAVAGGWPAAVSSNHTGQTPFAGDRHDVQGRTSITIRAAGRGLRGIVALGGPTRGRLQGSPDSELRAGGLDVNAAGAILVVGSRVDAETLTRARAMGVRGVVVTGLSSKERRDYLASEARQRSALHRLPPFAVLVLGGAVLRSRSAEAVRACSARCPGTRSRSSPIRRCSSSTCRAWLSRPRRRTWSGSVVVRWAAGRAASWRPLVGGDSPAAPPSRRAWCASLTARRRRSRSATSNASSDRRGRPRSAGSRPGPGGARPRLRSGRCPPRPLIERRGQPDPGATTALGLALAGAARPGDVLCLWGDLGAGKTHLAKAFGAGLGVTDTITSPSFILMAEYAGRLPLFHIDLYRLADASDALAGGLIDDRQAAG